MKHFDYIYDFAADHHGLVTAAEAKRLGVTGVELNRWCKIGRLKRIGYGVYGLQKRLETPLDGYAIATALVGEDAFLWHESVLAGLDLLEYKPKLIYVATPNRVRKALPNWIKLVTVSQIQADAKVSYEGIPSQRVDEAIQSCIPTMNPSILYEAVKSAHRKGLLSLSEFEQLKVDIGLI